MVILHPVAFCGRSAAIQATMIRPACGCPGGTMPTPAGTVLHIVYPCATTAPGTELLASTSTGGPKCAPPSVEMFTQIWLGPKKSWYMSTTSAFAVVPLRGTDAAVHWRSTPNGEQLVPHWVLPTTEEPCCQLHAVVHEVAIVDFHTSACSGSVLSVPDARLHQYSDLAWSVARQSSPLVVSAGWIMLQLAPPFVDR